jgi:hypothetical protein
MPVVPTPDDIDVVWLNQRLVEAGHDVELAGFSQADVGTGQVGRCICYQLQYGSQVTDAPASLVAKFSSDDPTSRDTGQAMKTYRTEVDFYRHIAPKVSIRVPKCYYAEIDEEDREHLLLMQDMTPAGQGDQVAGCSVEVARQAVLELVGLQAPTWQDDSWISLLGRVQDGPFADMKGLYNNTMPGFVERYATVLRPPIVDGRVLRFDEAPADLPQAYYWALEAAIEKIGRAPEQGIQFKTPYALATWADGTDVELLAINHWREEAAIPIRLLYPTDLGPPPEGNESSIRVRVPVGQADGVVKDLIDACYGRRL